MSLNTQSPFKPKEINIDFPITGKTKAFAYAKNSVVLAGEELPGFSELHLPVDTILNEPDLESKVEHILYMLNELDRCEPNASFKTEFDDGEMEFEINSQTNKVELNDTPLFQVITSEKMFDAGMYEIHEDAMITQDESLARKMCEEMDSQHMVFPLNKKISDFSQSEMARVINNHKQGVTLAKIRNTLNRYGIESYSNARDSASLISQTLRNVDPFDKRLVEEHFNRRGDVASALYNLIVDQRFSPTPIPAYGRAENENKEMDLFTSPTNNVQKGEVEGQYFIDLPNDGVIIVSREKPSQNEIENGITSIKMKP